MAKRAQVGDEKGCKSGGRVRETPGFVGQIGTCASRGDPSSLTMKACPSRRFGLNGCFRQLHLTLEPLKLCHSRHQIINWVLPHLLLCFCDGKFRFHGLLLTRYSDLPTQKWRSPRVSFWPLHSR